MKKLSLLLVILLLSLGILAGCATDEDGGTGTGVNEGDQSEETIMAALVLNQSLGDGSSSDAMNASLQEASEDFGIEVTTFEALEADKYEEAIRNFAQNDYDIIIAAFPGMSQAIQRVAADFPDITFVHIYSSEDYGLENIISVDYAAWEANYVAGVASALVSETGAIGHIVGSEDDTIVANYNAIVEGAQTVNPDATVERINAATFDDPAKGKEIALSLYNRNVDVIIGDAGKTTLGMIEAAEETGNLIIGDASDHSALAPGNVFMDTFLGFGEMVYNEIELYVNDQFESGIKYADYSNGGIGTFKNKGLAENSENEELVEMLPQVWEEVEELESQISNGDLVIEKQLNLPKKLEK